MNHVLQNGYVTSKSSFFFFGGAIYLLSCKQISQLHIKKIIIYENPSFRRYIFIQLLRLEPLEFIIILFDDIYSSSHQTHAKNQTNDS